MLFVFKYLSSDFRNAECIEKSLYREMREEKSLYI